MDEKEIREILNRNLEQQPPTDDIPIQVGYIVLLKADRGNCMAGTACVITEIRGDQYIVETMVPEGAALLSLSRDEFKLAL